MIASLEGGKNTLQCSFACRTRAGRHGICSSVPQRRTGAFNACTCTAVFHHCCFCSCHSVRQTSSNYAQCAEGLSAYCGSTRPLLSCCCSTALLTHHLFCPLQRQWQPAQRQPQLWGPQGSQQWPVPSTMGRVCLLALPSHPAQMLSAPMLLPLPAPSAQAGN